MLHYHYHYWILQTASDGRLCYVQDTMPYRSKATAWRHAKATGHEHIVLACQRLCLR